MLSSATLRRLRRLLRSFDPSIFTLFSAATLGVCALALAWTWTTSWAPPKPDVVGTSKLPEQVMTVRGLMDLEREYLPGVVDCEIAYYTSSPAALAAQAIAARTYVARFLARQGDSAVIPMGPHFQCWRPVVYRRSRDAAWATRGMVLRHQGALISGNYAAGAEARDQNCQAHPPKVHGLNYPSWAAVQRAYEKGKRFPGPAWTEIFITDNLGRRGPQVKKTGLGGSHVANRGALGQHAAICFAERFGEDTEALLRRFYGADVVLAR